MTTDIATTLIEALGADRVRRGDAIPERNGHDMSRFGAPTRPAILVLPRSTEEVATTLRICHAAGRPIVVQGGMTGLVGGAHPGADEIALSLERMVGVEEVDTTASTLTALAGTPLLTVQAAAEAAGLMCGVDLGARGSCSIGGNVATNAGGNQVIRYGMTRRNVLGLEAVLADGSVVSSLNKMMKNNAGYDWTQLFIGSEGTLGVVTRVVLALHPRPRAIESALVAVPSTEATLKLLRHAGAALPAGLLVFEAMWREMMDIAVDKVGLSRPFDPLPEVVVLIEAPSDGTEAGRDALEAMLADAIEAGMASDALVARSGADRARFWAYRESPYEHPKVLPRGVLFDVSIPLGAMAPFVEAYRAVVDRVVGDAARVVYGHVADSNLHLTVMPPSVEGGVKARIEEAIYDLVAAHGGSVSAEHGIGRMKRDYLDRSRAGPELALMRTLKSALDPKGILNPGRVL